MRSRRRLRSPAPRAAARPDGRHVRLSSGNMDWRTPGFFLDLVRCVGPIRFDPATSPDNPVGAEGFLDGSSPERCGLSNPWPEDGLTFVNPRYGAYLSGAIDPGGKVVKKGTVIGIGTGWASRIAAHSGETIALVPVRTETDWWATLDAWCSWKIYWTSPWFGRRINFVDPETGIPSKGSTVASAVFYQGPRPDRFLEVFLPHGRAKPGLETLQNYVRMVGPEGTRRAESSETIEDLEERIKRDHRLAELLGR